MKYRFILKMLGCLLYFLLHATTNQFHLPYHKRCSYLCQFLMCSQCYKKRFERFSYFCIICQNFATFSKCYFVLRPIFSVKSGDNVFQNNLISVILLRFKFSKYCHFLSFKNLLQSLDLNMIACLSSLSVTFFWLAQFSYLFLTRACLRNK